MLGRSTAIGMASILLSLLATRGSIGQDQAIDSQEPFPTGTMQPSVQWTRPGDDWPRMLGTLGNSTSFEQGLSFDWTAGLPILWKQPTGTGYANGVAADGRYFQFDRFGNRERLTCFVAETGEILWAVEDPVEYSDMYGYNNGPRASPVVSGEYVVTYGVAGRLSVRKVSDGACVWSTETSDVYQVPQNFFGVASCPLVWHNDLWVMVGGTKDGTGPSGTAMVCFDLDTGREIARVGEYLASYATPIVAEFGGRPYLLSLVREGLLVIDLQDRSFSDFKYWRAEIRESVNAASPVVVGGEILISETYGPGSISFELRDGKLHETWRDVDSRKDKLLRAHWATPVVLGEYIYACSGRNEPDASLRCIHWPTKKLMWSERIRERTTLLAVDEYLIVLCESGYLLLIKQDPSKMDVVARVDYEKLGIRDDYRRPIVAYPAWAPPVLSHGLLFIRGVNTIVCHDLGDKATRD